MVTMVTFMVTIIVTTCSNYHGSYSYHLPLLPSIVDSSRQFHLLFSLSLLESLFAMLWSLTLMTHLSLPLFTSTRLSIAKGAKSVDMKEDSMTAHCANFILQSYMFLKRVWMVSLIKPFCLSFYKFKSCWLHYLCRIVGRFCYSVSEYYQSYTGPALLMKHTPHYHPLLHPHTLS